jgi:endonuclease/exonuclease/phosphatase family metal-dependent hydrolase
MPNMRLRIATLNTWGLPEPFAEDVAPRLAEIGRRLRRLELDAIAFQEVWTAQGQVSLIRAGREAGLAHSWHGGSGIRGSGLLVLSRLPIESVRFERYALAGDPSFGEYYGGKGFAEVRLATPAGPVTLVDTHLHARYAGDAAHEYRPLRTGQIVQLAASARALPGPVVVAGDFNLHDGLGDEYGMLLGLTGLRDAAAEVSAFEPTVYRENPYRGVSKKPDRRIDLLLARDGGGLALRSLRATRVFDTPFEHAGREIACSNHAGVLAELEVAPSEGAALPPPDPRAVAFAAEQLAAGRAIARGSRREGRRIAGAGAGAALIASAGLRMGPLSRRALLRGALRTAGVAALAPVLGFSFVSEVVAPDQLRAFDALSAELARLSGPGAPAGEVLT